ncbi:carbohydrate ABC transporter substrate-binding protein [Verminephrobacter aporrectodeae subsp. tuberculatae]|nr:carbohydrate ABC transporter substrate-binding protein [Verminephrobacter aporrectodeae subsp. tuberculatae]MCW8201782.1 carbohydrate ABC transporter substrate-binding protein [Verminephrobacter aporrectodeae subsp. tuberculatae]
MDTGGKTFIFCYLIQTKSDAQPGRKKAPSGASTRSQDKETDLKTTPIFPSAACIRRAVPWVALVLACSARAGESVEVMHWWTSGGETAAVGKFKEALSVRGVEWKDLAVGGADNQRTLLKTRVGKGSPPDAAQINSDVRAYAANPGNLANLNDVAAKGGWDDALPAPVQRYAKLGGKNYVAVPVNVHRNNVMWISAAGLKKIGASAPPKTWDEFFAMAEKARAAGMIPLAMAEDSWVNFMFMQVAYGTMHTDAFRKAFYDADEAALKGPGMVQAFEVMRKARGYSDRGAATRRWNEATQMVIQGKALAQVNGDWVKGEFTLAGKKPNVDYFCIPVPGSGSGHVFSSDAFMFFRNAKSPSAQVALAETLMDKDAQVAFSLIKGSVPVRMDADVSGFDACARQSYADFVAGNKDGTLAAAPSMLQTPARIAAWRDVVLAFWNDDSMTAQQAANRMLAAARAN